MDKKIKEGILAAKGEQQSFVDDRQRFAKVVDQATKDLFSRLSPMVGGSGRFRIYLGPPPSWEGSLQIYIQKLTVKKGWISSSTEEEPFAGVKVEYSEYPLKYEEGKIQSVMTISFIHVRRESFSASSPNRNKNRFEEIDPSFSARSVDDFLFEYGRRIGKDLG